MQEEYADVINILVKAFEESNGETVDLIVEHGELCGLTPEMLEWWGANINDSSRYRMWCPEDHISFEIEALPSEGRRVSVIIEKIGEFPASMLRLRHEDPDSLSIQTIYKHRKGSSFLGPNSEPVACLCNEFEATHNGVKMRTTFRFPAQTPQRFLNAMHEHCIKEMGHFPEFLPELYRQNT